jgi:hypothetical protein
MRVRLLPLTVLWAASTVAFAGSADLPTNGAIDVPVNAHSKYTFQCASSGSGVCHNILLAQSGVVADRFSVGVGRSRVVYDLPTSLRLCVTDGPTSDTSTCQNARPISELLTAPAQ